MSLVGNLEDLGLGEILQIVSLSRKTGILFLSSRGREGSICFRQGQVVKANSSTYQESIGEVLIQKGIIDLGTLRKALSVQQEAGFRDRLGVILARDFGIEQERIEDVVREQIENVVYSLFAWIEGSFTFELHNSIETVDGTRMDPLQFMLEQGLNTQFLAMEGTRIFDEKRHGSRRTFSNIPAADDRDDDFEFDLTEPVHGGTASPKPEHQPIVIVDDDGPTLRAIADGLTERGFDVHAMTRSEDTLIEVDALHRAGERPTVLMDLIMPKMDGSGVLGGIELLELISNNFSDLRLIVMTDYHHADAEKKVYDRGCHFIVKPRRAEISDQVILDDFLDRLIQNIRQNTFDDQNGSWQSRYNLGDELRIEMGDDDDLPAVTDPGPQGGGLTLLRGMLEELNNPDLQGGVLLLVLRFASEFLNRAIAFMISDNIVAGSGQFGIYGGSISGDDRVRSIQFPLESGSMFQEPYRTGQALTGSPQTTPLDMHIFEQLGGGTPQEYFIGPLVSQSRVIGFLYGDNLPDKRPVGDVDSLTIFLSQAGLAMERSLLERQLLERAAR